MRYLSIPVLVALVLVGCGGGGPEDAVRGFFDALKNGDGTTASSYLSESAVTQIGQGLTQIKADPTGLSLSAMNAALGTQITQEQISVMDAQGFAGAILSGTTAQQQVGTVPVDILSSSVSGDNATVTARVTVGGQPVEQEIPLVRENGGWRIASPEFGM